MGRKWRAIDIEIIRNNLHMTNSELADALNRTAAAVQCKKKKLHLKMPIRYIQQETAWNKLNHAIGRGDIQGDSASYVESLMQMHTMWVIASLSM